MGETRPNDTMRQILEATAFVMPVMGLRYRDQATISKMALDVYSPTSAKPSMGIKALALRE